MIPEKAIHHFNNSKYNPDAAFGYMEVDGELYYFEALNGELVTLIKKAKGVDAKTKKEVEK